WTPFRFDVTELVRKSPDKPSTLRVRVDERVGHNTQGFLPIIQPHYGGLWQGVGLIVGGPYFDDSRLMAVGDVDRGELVIDWPRTSHDPSDKNRLVIRYRLGGTKEWTFGAAESDDTAPPDVCRHRLKVPGFEPWSPDRPNLYEVELPLPVMTPEEHAGWPPVKVRAAFRKVEANGRQLLLNGKPL